MAKKIRVLFTIPNLNTAGSGVALYKLISSLNKDLFEIHVLCLHSKGELFKTFANSDFKMHIFRYTHGMRPLLSGLRHCWKISRWIREQAFDIVYSYHYTSDYSEPLAVKLAGCKWVFVKKNMGWFGASLRSWRLRSFLADSIVVQNKEMLQVFYPKSKKATLISIGVDTEEFYSLNGSAKKILPIESAKNFKTIGVVANFVPVKGLEILIKAFETLYKHYNLRLVLVGDKDSEYGESLIKLVEELKIPDDLIFFVGKQSNINEWLNTFDLFIQPTLNEGRREGAPIAVQEAVSAGTLVLGSKICGIEDQLSTTPKLLFEPGSVEDLANKIKYILSLDENAINALKEKQKSHLLENYTLKSEVEAIEKHLTSLMR